MSEGVRCWVCKRHVGTGSRPPRWFVCFGCEPMFFRLLKAATLWDERRPAKRRENGHGFEPGGIA